MLNSTGISVLLIFITILNPFKVFAQVTDSGTLPNHNSQGSVYLSGLNVGQSITIRETAGFLTCNNNNNKQEICNGQFYVSSPENLGKPVDMSNITLKLEVAGKIVNPNIVKFLRVASSEGVEFQLPSKLSLSCTDKAILTIDNIKIVKAVKSSFDIILNCNEYFDYQGQRVMRSLMKQNLMYSSFNKISFKAASKSPVPTLINKITSIPTPSSLPEFVEPTNIVSDNQSPVPKLKKNILYEALLRVYRVINEKVMMIILGKSAVEE